MNCEDARRRVHDAIDEGHDDAALDAHLNECVDCRAYADEIRLVAATLDRLGDETAGVTSRLPNRDGNRRRRLNAWNVLRGTTKLTRIAAMLAILVTISLVFVPRPPRERTVLPTGDTGDPSTAQNDPRLSSAVDPSIGITLRGDSSANWLAVAQPTSEDDVRMYWLYPVLDRKQTTE